LLNAIVKRENLFLFWLFLFHFVPLVQNL